jgi:cytoskeleton protein RodZ
MSSRFEHHAGPGDEASSAALKEIGHLLRETRQARGLDLHDVADDLRIKPDYLLALEEGDLSLTPGRVYALGFLRSYGEHLGFDGEEMVGYAKQAMSGAAARPELKYRVPEAESRRPSGILIAASILTVGLIYGGWRMLYRDQPVLERVSAVPGDVGRIASQVFTLGNDSPAAQPSGSGGSTSVATSATAATPSADEAGALAAAVTPPVDVVPDPESALASTPTRPVTPAPAAAGAAADGAAALPRSTGPAAAEAGGAAIPGAFSGTSGPPAVVAGPSPAAMPGAGPAERMAASAAPVPAAAADGGSARALLASLESATPAAAGVATAPAAAGADDHVVLVASQESWVQVRSKDRQYVRTWTLQAGERFVVPERGDLALWTGNAGGLDVLIDGRNLGALGNAGRVMRDVPLTADALEARLASSR